MLFWNVVTRASYLCIVIHSAGYVWNSTFPQLVSFVCVGWASLKTCALFLIRFSLVITIAPQDLVW